MFICIEMKSHFPSRSHQYYIQCVVFPGLAKGKCSEEFWAKVRERTFDELFHIIVILRKSACIQMQKPKRKKLIFEALEKKHSYFLSFNDACASCSQTETLSLVLAARCKFHSCTQLCFHIYTCSFMPPP